MRSEYAFQLQTHEEFEHFLYEQALQRLLSASHLCTLVAAKYGLGDSQGQNSSFAVRLITGRLTSTCFYRRRGGIPQHF